MLHYNSKEPTFCTSYWMFCSHVLNHAASELISSFELSAFFYSCSFCGYHHHAGLRAYGAQQLSAATCH